MSRNRTHRLEVRGVSVRHFAEVILAKYPDAKFRDSLADIDLGVPVPDTVVAPITEAEGTAHWNVGRLEPLRGVSDELKCAVDALREHPAIAALCQSHATKLEKNQAAGRRAAKFEDAERHELDRLLQGRTK